MGSARHEFIEKVKKELDRLNSEIDRLETDLHAREDEVRRRYTMRKVELEKRRQELNERLVEMEVAGENAWEELKAGLDDARNALQEGIERARKEFSGKS
jgi:chromosome segregation ATPase